MAQIGGVQVDILRGEPQGLRRVVDTWVVPGLDGFGALSLGRQDRGAALSLVKFGPNHIIQQWVRDIEGLQGSFVSITDDRGNQYTNILIREVAQPRVTTAFHAGGLRVEIEVFAMAKA